MHYYYSIYRKDYLYKGIVLYESMKIHDDDFKFYLVCMEDESLDLLNKMNCSNLVPISIKEIEEFDPRIPELKCQRGEKTYVWTAKASVPLYLFDKYPQMDHVIWLDGDTEFLSKPDPIYDQWGDRSVLLTEERFTGEYEYIGHLVGFFNTGFMGFKNDEIGIKCLNYFKERLQEWKNDVEEQGNWNDQHYVNDWTTRFQNVGVVAHDGINLTPFIASRINNEQNGFVNIREGIPYIKDTPIVLYHFMALKYYDGNEFDLCNYWMKFDRETIKKLYIPYFEKCNKAYAAIKEINPEFYENSTIKDKYIENYFNLKVNQSEPVYNLCTITMENKLLQTLALLDSLRKFKVKFRLWVCCGDETSYNILEKLELPEVQLLDPSNIIPDYYSLALKGYHPSLQVLKPRLVNLLLLNNFSIEKLLYVDCDYYFHQSPKLIFDQLQNHAILLFASLGGDGSSHILTSIIGFSREVNALDCIYYWVQKCNEWMGNEANVQDEIHYISRWKQGYKRVNILDSLTYIADDESLEKVRVRKVISNIYINNKLLVLYKYNLNQNNSLSMKETIEQIFNTSPIYKRHIYLPYLKSISNCLEIQSKSSGEEFIEER